MDDLRQDLLQRFKDAALKLHHLIALTDELFVQGAFAVATTAFVGGGIALALKILPVEHRDAGQLANVAERAVE